MAGISTPPRLGRSFAAGATRTAAGDADGAAGRATVVPTAGVVGRTAGAVVGGAVLGAGGVVVVVTGSGVVVGATVSDGEGACATGVATPPAGVVAAPHPGRTAEIPAINA